MSRGDVMKRWAWMPMLLVVAACGGGEEASEAAPAPSASAAVETWTPQQCLEAGQAEWAKHCQGVDLTGVLKEVPLGAAYEIYSLEDGEPKESMTINAVECGLTELQDAADNPEWDGSDDIPETIDVTADPGMEFCRITATLTKTGKKPTVGWTDFGNLVTADGTEYAEDVKAEEATDTINYEGPNECSPTLCRELNPGTPPFEVVKVYQVPAGTEPRGVQYPMATLVSEPEALLLLS